LGEGRDLYLAPLAMLGGAKASREWPCGGIRPDCNLRRGIRRPWRYLLGQSHSRRVGARGQTWFPRLAACGFRTNVSPVRKSYWQCKTARV